MGLCEFFPLFRLKQFNSSQKQWTQKNINAIRNHIPEKIEYENNNPQQNDSVEVKNEKLVERRCNEPMVQH